MPSEADRIKERTFNQVKRNPPARVRRVEEKRGKRAAQKMRTAIALDEARRQGARIPRNT